MIGAFPREGGAGGHRGIKSGAGAIITVRRLQAMKNDRKRNAGRESRRRPEIPLGWALIAVVALLVFLAPAVSGQEAAGPPRAQRVESVGLTVSEMDRAIDFYTRVLAFEKVSDREIWSADFARLVGVFGARARIVRLRLGDEHLELTEYLNSNGRPAPVDSRSNDRWFQHVAIIVSDIDRAFEKLRANKVRFASTAPQTLPATIPAAAGIRAFYFRDPDNHVLEILQFPPDKGAAKWRRPEPAGRLFLGLDHTAIVVGDTDESLEFYRGALGLAVAGTSENFGTEQEHLNNVFGARLRITALRTADEGMAVELLEYLAPRDGREFPKDTRSSDLWHWQTSFAVRRADELALFLRRRKFEFVSGGPVSAAEAAPGFDKGLLVRDPDGHAVRVLEK
jgi:catechol 2,3-dioxygenase-like lactoylglutathione lyase family enzyme